MKEINMNEFEPNNGTEQNTAPQAEELTQAAATENTQTEEPKKSRKGLIIALATLVVLAIIAVSVMMLFNSPKAKVSKGLDKTFKSIHTPFSDYLDEEAFSALLNSGAHEQQFSLTLDDMTSEGMNGLDSSMLNGLGFAFSGKTDLKNKALSADCSLLYGGSDLLTLGIYGYDNSLAYSIPELFDGYLEIPLANIKDDFNNSMWSSMSGTTLDEDVEFTLFPDYSEGTTSFAEAFATTYAQDIDALKKAISVTKADKKLISVAGTEQNCKGYRILVPAAEYQVVFNDLLEFMQELPEFQVNAAYYRSTFDSLKVELNEDIELMAYLDKKGYVVNLTSSLLFTTETVGQTSVNLDLAWNGTDYLFDDFTIAMTVSDDEYGPVELTFHNVSQTTDTLTTNTFTFTGKEADVSPLISISGDTSFDSSNGITFATLTFGDDVSTISASLSGGFVDIVAGENYAFNIDELILKIDDSDSVTFAGDYSFSALDGEVAAPSGTAYNVFELDETTTNSLLQEIYTNFLSSDLGTMFSAPGAIY